jgi:hypothetical protein
MRLNANLDEVGREALQANRDACIMYGWVMEQRAFGRPEDELIWSNCVRELQLTNPNRDADLSARVERYRLAGEAHRKR